MPFGTAKRRNGYLDTSGNASDSQGRPASRLVAVVVTYNRLPQLKVTLSRLLHSAAEDLQAVIVFDNASNDGSAAWLASQHDPRLVVSRSETNLGGAGGFAGGMALARDRFDPDWMVVMDDDARPEPGALSAFHTRDLSQWDALAAAVYFPDGRICEMNRPSRNPFSNGRAFWRTLLQGRDGFHVTPEAYEGTDSLNIDVTSFVGFFISRKGLALAGLPDPGLFLYGDDGLYTLGLSMKGGRIAFAPDLRFEHDCSTFASSQRGRFHPLWKAYYYHRNLLLLYRMAAGWLFWPVLLVIVPKWLTKARHHQGERLLFLALIGRALRDGLLRRTNVAHKTILAWAEKR
ncbi:glycosyltransferase [uncultured Thioclava sp.]|uniref:glycosyltransferase n=1 Tax=uncultured Thioclava sp. TaxID=473858 RepID=UPI0025ED17E5|nr:glycosyltransferase [uncultured Thioclava sp.]